MTQLECYHLQNIRMDIKMYVSIIKKVSVHKPHMRFGKTYYFAVVYFDCVGITVSTVPKYVISFI